MVLWIISELFPPDETSTSYILGEIANAACSEYEVKVICGPAVYDKNKRVDLVHPFLLNPSVEVYRSEDDCVDKNTIAGKIHSFWATSKRLFALAKRDVKDGDKVLLVTNPAPLILLMSKMRTTRQFELNILVHDVFPENTLPAGIRVPLFAFKLIKKMFDRAYSRADKLIAIGRDMADVLRRKTGNNVEIVIVENWGDVDGIHPQPFPNGPIRLEYAGNLGRVQGLDKLIDGLPDGIELHLYGSGAMEQVLKDKKKTSVFFHGPYLRSQQQEILGACHASIVTLSEGMYGLGVPSKAYNILASGRPIIYFGPKNGEIGLLIREFGIGYIGWPSKWDMEELIEMGTKARELAVSSYSKRAILDKFLKALR